MVQDKEKDLIINSLNILESTSKLLQKTLEKSEKQINWFKFLMFTMFFVFIVNIITSNIRDIKIAKFSFIFIFFNK
jgi:hypothetical protein